MGDFTYEEVEALLHLARDATAGDSFEARLLVVTDHLAMLVPYTALTLMVVGPNGAGHMLCRNATPHDLRAYTDHYMAHDPMVQKGPFGTEGAVVALSDVVSTSEFGRDAFTGEFLPAHGLRYALGVSPTMPDGAVLSLGMHREQALGDFTTKERKLLRLAAPDVGRAAFATILQEKLTRMSEGASTSATQGMITFSARGDVLRADDGALGICALLGAGQGRVPADLFVVEVRRLASEGPGSAAERMIPLAGGGSVKVRLDAVDTPTGRQVVGSLEVQRTPSPERLAAFAERHRLSSRERDVATLAIEGLGNRGIGFKLGISEITVGTHLTKIYRKTRVSNRTELAKLLLEG